MTSGYDDEDADDNELMFIVMMIANVLRLIGGA